MAAQGCRRPRKYWGETLRDVVGGMHMKRFIAVFAVVMFVGAITMPVIAQAQAQAPAVKGTEGPDVRKQEPKGTEGPDVKKK